MRLDSLAVNQSSQEAYDWLLEFLSAVDARNPYALGILLAEDCTLQSNSDPPVEGRAKVLGHMHYFWPNFRALEHEPLSIYGADRTVAFEALSHYTCNDTTPVVLREAAFIDRDEGGRVTSIRLFTDTTPLFIRDRHRHRD